LVFLYKGEHSKLLISILCKYDAGEWGENWVMADGSFTISWTGSLACLSFSPQW
jgi:hypothetical protein